MTLHIPVRLQKFEKKDKRAKSSASVRVHIGTLYFAEGTTANEVCVHITKTQNKELGLWLLQKGRDNNNTTTESGSAVDDGDFETVKDSKYALEDGIPYVALHYSGADIELII